MLKEITVAIDNLLLDPNNPRFIDDLGERTHVPDEKLADKQEDTLRRFSRTPKANTNDAEFDVANIKDLYDSMLRIGYVGIDRVVVRPAGQDGKFLVLEGNRRVATVKTILKGYDGGTMTELSERRNVEVHLASFRTLRVMLLDTEGLPEEEVERRVSVLLGIRHHGSLLEWEPLPRAYNIYTEYIYESPDQTTFRFDSRRAREVAQRLCIDRGEVKDALRTYVVYLQVRERFPEVEDDHFSLIEYGMKNRHLLGSLPGSYFKADEDTFQLDEKSLTKLNQVCQFAARDALPTATTKKIVRDPKQFVLLGRLVDKMQCATHPAVKSYAADLIRRVEDQSDTGMTLDRAVDDMTSFENRTEWADAVARLLDKQKDTDKLPIETYKGNGNDRGNKEELKATVERIRKSMGL